MSAERRPSKSNSRVGWFSMLTVGVIVVAAGFAVGIVAGVTWEEPGLVIGWVTGETDGIEWSVDDREVAGSSHTPEDVDTSGGDALARAGINVPDVAAPPPLGGRNAPAASASDRPAPPGSSAVIRRKPEPAPSPSRAPDRQEASADAGEFSVQVGAFAERTGADELSDSLRRAGYKVYLSDSKRGARYRVRVGPYATRPAAETAAERLETSQQLPTWVLREDS